MTQHYNKIVDLKIEYFINTFDELMSNSLSTTPQESAKFLSIDSSDIDDEMYQNDFISLNYGKFFKFVDNLLYVHSNPDVNNIKKNEIKVGVEKKSLMDRLNTPTPIISVIGEQAEEPPIAYEELLIKYINEWHKHINGTSISSYDEIMNFINEQLMNGNRMFFNKIPQIKLEKRSIGEKDIYSSIAEKITSVLTEYMNGSIDNTD